MEKLEKEQESLLENQDVYNPKTKQFHKIGGSLGKGNRVKAKTSKRIKRAAELLELPKQEAVQILSKEEKIGEEMARIYMNKAIKVMYEQDMQAVLDIKMQHIEMLMKQYEKADMTGKIEAAVKVIREMGELQGFYDKTFQNNIFIQNNVKQDEFDWSKLSVEHMEIITNILKQYEK